MWLHIFRCFMYMTKPIYKCSLNNSPLRQMIIYQRWYFHESMNFKFTRPKRCYGIKCWWFLMYVIVHTFMYESNVKEINVEFLVLGFFQLKIYFLIAITDLYIWIILIMWHVTSKPFLFFIGLILIIFDKSFWYYFLFCED